MKLKLLSIVLVLLSSSASPAQTQSLPTAPPFKIISLKAMLFYDNQGTFSRDVAEPESDVFTVPSILWNTPIEGASREGAATSVLVTVEVSGEYVAGVSRKIQLIAKYKSLENERPTVLRLLAPITIRENGKYIAGFWLNNVGCNPVKLAARVVGQKQSSRIDRIIKFGCGE